MKIPKGIGWISTGKTLGQGGQAQVYEVYRENDSSQKKYALKALSSDRPQKAYERFYREITAIKDLSNPYIINIIDYSNPDSEFHFYVMEFIDGALSLKKLINENRNPYYCNGLHSLRLLDQLLLAIKDCKDNDPQIIHRDLNPANILVCPNQEIKIIDFGLCQIEDETPITLIDEGVGTQNYMAPECESGVEGQIGIHSDVYSIGKVIWSAITNQMAFAREKPVFTNRSLQKTHPDNPKLWHFQHIFSSTIRQDIQNRKTVEELIEIAKRVRYLTFSNYPPLELLSQHCPICGWGKLDSFQGSHMVFGNPNPRNISALQCDYCGYCFVGNFVKQRDNLKKFENSD